MTHQSLVQRLCIAGGVLCLLAGAAAASAQILMLTADTEGHLGPCDHCTVESGLGGLERRATLVGEMRRQHGAETLLLDAGNALFGGESLASEGRVIVAAYNAMGYDAVNLSYRDFRRGKRATLEAIAQAEFAVISASVIDADTGMPLAEPFVVRELDGRRIGLIGITAAPAGMETLPHLREQLAGIRIVPPLEALNDHLPDLRRQADRVVVLYYGSASDLRALRRALADSVDAILVGGVQSARLPAATGGVRPALIGTREHGAYLASVALHEDGDELRLEVEQHAIEPTIDPDPAMRELLASFGPPRLDTPLAVTRPRVPAGATLPTTLDPGGSYRLDLVMRNRAAEIRLKHLELIERYGEREPSDQRRFVLLSTEWENVIPLTLIDDEHIPTAYRIPTMGDHLYLVVNGNRVARLLGDAHQLAGHVPVRNFQLEHIGDRLRGNLLFEIPDKPIDKLELRLYDYAHGHARAPLTYRPGDPDPIEPITPLKVNEIVEAGVFDMRLGSTLDDHAAPVGMTFVAIELQARSMFTYGADATAFDPHAERGTTTQVGTVADWLEAHRYLHVIVDGERAYLPEAELTSLPAEPRFLPDVMTGGRCVFLVPEQFNSLELRGDFPNARLPDGRVIRPAPIHLSLRGERPNPAQRDPIWHVEDDTIHVAIVDQRIADRFAGTAARDDQRFFVIEVTVRTVGERPEFFQTVQQLRYVDRQDRQHRLHEATFAGVHRPSENVWVPNGQRRTFEIAYLIDRAEGHPRIAYRGFTLAQMAELRPIDETEDLAHPAQREVMAR